MTQMYAQQLLVRSLPLLGGGQPVVRRMLRNNAIEAWETMQKSAGNAVSPGSDLVDDFG